MRNLLFVFVALIGVSFLSSCSKEDISDTDLLISEIANSQAKVAVNTEDLPLDITSYTETNFFESYIASAFMVERKGYEVVMGGEEHLYFDENGQRLRPKRHRRPKGCGGYGETVAIEDLPSDITTYITANYPNEVLVRAKTIKDGLFLVGLDSKTIVVFDADGNFIKESDCLRTCTEMGETVEPEDLPTDIGQTITATYPDAEIKIAFLKEDKYIVGMLLNGERKIMGFLADGTVLFDK